MREEELKNLIEKLRRGIETDGFVLVCGEPKRGRFAQELNLDLSLLKGSKKAHLLHAKVFLGRAEYRDWVELFGIAKEVLGTPYFGSNVESKVLDLFSPLTGRLFVEYYDDMDTVRELSAGVPPALSRLGFELARRGFMWFKDWYFPEGLMEGGHKLQAERPENRELFRKYLHRLEEELGNFLNSSAEKSLKKLSEERFKILEDTWKKIYSSAS